MSFKSNKSKKHTVLWNLTKQTGFTFI